MKKYQIRILINLSVSIVLLTACATGKILTRAEQLIEAQKYKSAYQLLQENDPGNLRPELVIKKNELVLNYSADNRRHELFLFLDLESGEDLEMAKKNIQPKAQEEFVIFPAEKVLNSLITEYPANYRLRLALGHFYFAVYQTSEDTGQKTGADLKELYQENYQAAWQHKIFDYLSLSNLGVERMEAAEYDQAISFFEQSVSLKPDYAPSHHQLAKALYLQDEKLMSLAQAQTAHQLYREAESRAETAILIGLIHQDLKEFDLAEEYYQLAAELDPGNFFALRSLLSINYYLGNQEQKQNYMEIFFSLDPKTPAVYNEMLNLASYYQGEAELLHFFETKLLEHKNDVLISSNLHLYCGYLTIKIGLPLEAALHLYSSWQGFNAVYEPDHAVFGMLDELYSSIQ